MKTLYVLIALTLVCAAPVAHAQSRNGFGDNASRDERGLFPMLLRWLNEREENRETAAESAAQRQEEQTDSAMGSPGDEPATKTPAAVSETAPQAPTEEAADQTTPQAAPAAGPATTPGMLNIHNATSDIYKNQSLLSRAEAGALFVLSIALSLSGLLLAERGGMRRILSVRPLLPKQIPAERTALS